MPRNVSNPFVIHLPTDLLQSHPNLRSLSKQLSIKYIHREMVTDADLQLVGQQLWQVLDIDEAFDQARQEASPKVLPLVISCNDPALLSLPWESLYHPSIGFLCKHNGFTLFRHLGLKHPQDLSCGPLRVLLFTSLPEDVDPEKARLDIESEQAHVLEALDPWIKKGLVKLTAPDDGRFSALCRLLREEAFHLVFLSGHGTFKDDPLSSEQAETFFLFEGENWKSDPIEAKEIASAFIGAPVQCVVLSACESGKLASDDLNTGLATHLLQSGIPHVVGMRESVLDRAATMFSRVFCEALVRRERLDIAVQEGRMAITRPIGKNDRRLDTGIDVHAELSLGQWCLPVLYSCDPARGIIDWDFTPERQKRSLLRITSLADISLPEFFIGRRKELRRLDQTLSKGVKQVLITGAGGQGKTALAGRLARKLEDQGYQVYAYSARPPAHWERFISNIQLSLDKDLSEEVDRKWGVCNTPDEKARLLLNAMITQTEGRMVLFFDNLESVQDPTTREITDTNLRTWLSECGRLGKDSPIMLLTSRWTIPEWEGDIRLHHQLARPGYGDFLRYTQQLSLRGERERLRVIYSTLGGNFKGLQLFHSLQQLGADEDAFLRRLTEARKELQAYMAVEQVVGYLNKEELELLNCLRAYDGPVIVDGVLVIAPDLPDQETLLERLVALSLADTEFDQTLQLTQYLLSPLIVEWLQGRYGPVQTEIKLSAARYQLWVFENLRTTEVQALTTHAAMASAGLHEEADSFALDVLVPNFDRKGMYHTLLETWLPPICKSPGSSVRASALGWSGSACIHTGDYDTALDYLKQSLKIRREIGDRAGEGTTLNNISNIYHARGDYDTALDYLKQSLKISREIGDRAGEEAMLNNISQVYKARGDFDTALDYLKQSLKIRREIGNRAGEGTTLGNISALYHARGDYDTALDYLKQSLKIIREIGDRAGEGTILNNISQIYKARGDYDTALDYLKQSLKIIREIGDRAGEGTTLNNISQIYHARGDYDTALDYLKQSLKIIREIGDRAGEGTTLNNISQIYHARGDFDTALDYLKQSLKIIREIGDRAGEGNILNNISTLYHARGDFDTALDYLKQSLKIIREIGNRAGEGTTLGNISALYHARGDYDTALDYLKQSLKIRREIGDRAGLCVTLFNIAHIHLAKKETGQATSNFVKAYVLAKEIGYSQVLEALENMTQDQGGLAFWENMANQLGILATFV